MINDINIKITISNTLLESSIHQPLLLSPLLFNSYVPIHIPNTLITMEALDSDSVQFSFLSE